jgi:hypothetical protein
MSRVIFDISEISLYMLKGIHVDNYIDFINLSLKRMANDQEMKLKSQKHHNSSLDKSLRPAVS